METNKVNLQIALNEQDEINLFMLGNTRAIEITQLHEDYFIPVFSRDNIETISHADFIKVVANAAQTYSQG